MALTVSGRTLYTVLELSEKLNVTTVTIRNYLKQGKIRGQKAMGRWFISEEDVTKLKNMGVGELFTPGTPTTEVVSFLKNWIKENPKELLQ